MTEKSEETEEKRSNDYPVDPHVWQAWAISLAIILVVCTSLVFFLWVIQATDEAKMWTRVQILGAATAFGAGIVTFCTVIWRGMIATTQAELQREQIAKVSDQIAAADRQNLAGLFHKGAELIAEDNTAKIAAGISTLQIVALGPDEDFAIQALNIIADHLQAQGAPYLLTPQGLSAIKALNSSRKKMGRYARRNMKFAFAEHEANDIEIDQIPLGVSSVRIENASVDATKIGVIPEELKLSIYESVVYDGKINLQKYRIRDSKFIDCKITGYRSIFRNSYEKCDFSECEINSKLPNLIEADCYYIEGNPPVGDIKLWSGKLIVRSVGYADADDDEIPF